MSELVTYGFPKGSAAVSADRVGCHPDATLLSGGKHLAPADYHKAMDHPNSVMIDVRNFNESIIGKFAPPQVILPTAPGTSNEGGSSPLLVPLPAVSWPWGPAWGSLEPPRRDGGNAQKTGKNGGRNGRDTV